MTSARLWIAGARPRTLPAAIVPVTVGTAAATGHGIVWWRAAAAMVVAVAIQVATNYVNDYADGVRGTDDERRVGPVRLVGGGHASPAAVKRAALVSFGVAGLAGLAVAVTVGPELVIVGAASFAAGWFYTGGSKPYGYLGLGELFVFVFFGLVATVGSTYVHTESIESLSIAASIPVGLVATALLVANNLRDIPGDTAAGKRTLAVRLGDPSTRRLYVALLALTLVAPPLLAVERPGALLALVAAPLAIPPGHAVRSGARGRALIPVLAGTGRFQLGFGLLLAAGLAI